MVAVNYKLLINGDYYNGRLIEDFVILIHVFQEFYIN